MTAQDEFNKIFAVRIVGNALSSLTASLSSAAAAATDSSSALSFEVQGTRSRWRVVRSRADFSALAEKFAGTSKIPRLPSPSKGASGLGKWLSSVFWLFKGRRRSSTGGSSTPSTPTSSSSSLSSDANDTADTNLQHLLNFLNPVCADAEVRHSAQSGNTSVISSDNDDTDSVLSSRTTLSARTSAANSAAGSDHNDHPFETRPPLASPSSSSLASSSATHVTATANLRDDRRDRSGTPTARARRRDSVDGMIANFVPDIVSTQMAQLKSEKDLLQRRYENDRKRWQAESKQIRSVLQQRYEGLMTAAEQDREGLELQINELKLKNSKLTQGLEQALEQQLQQQPQHVEHPPQQQLGEIDAQKEMYNQAISSAVKEAAEAASKAASNSAVETINMLRSDNDNLRAQMSLLETRLRKECASREEAQSAVVRMEREVKRLGESREREVMLREVAENAVFEAESEIERHRVLYNKERQKRKKLSDKLSFYKQLEQRLKKNAADSTAERIQWLFDDKQHSARNARSSDDKTDDTSSSTSSAATGSASTSTSSFDNLPGSQSRDHRPRSLSFELRHMSVSALRKLLDERKVPHRDCLEKGELLFRAKQTLSAEAAEMTETERVAVAAEEQLRRKEQQQHVGGAEPREEKKTERKEDWEETVAKAIVDNNDISSEDEGTKESQYDDTLFGSSHFEGFAADAISPNKSDEERNDAGAAASDNAEGDDEDGLVFRLSRRGGKRGAATASSLPVAHASDQKGQASAAELRKKKHEKLRAKRRAATGKQRSGRRINRRENRRPKHSPESSSAVPSTTVPPPPTPSPPTPPPALASSSFALPTPCVDDPFDLPDLQRSARTPPPPSAPTYTPSRGTNQRIEERRLREELVTQQRAEQKVRQLRQAEQVHKAQARQTERVQGTIKDQVQRWAAKKSLIRMLCTLEKIMPGDRVSLPKLDLRLSSTAADVKRAYKQALRAVHPDKLATASVDDRVRGEFVFSALRESYARSEKLKEDKERGRATNAASPRGVVGGKRRSSAGMNSPAWSRRW